MPREINDTQSYQDKIVKLIPTEIVGAYLCLNSLILSKPADSAPYSYEVKVLTIVVSALLLVLTPFYAWRVNKVTSPIQLIVTTISFAVWVYVIGGPFVAWNIESPRTSAVVMVLWTLLIPLAVSVPESEPQAPPVGVAP